MTPEELEALLKKGEQNAKNLVLKSKEELLADAQRTFGPGLAQVRKVPRWKLWLLGLAVLTLVAIAIALRQT